MLKNIPIVAAALSLVICLILYGQHYGFDLGTETADAIYKEMYGRPSLSGGGQRTYEFFAERYFYISCFLTVYLIGVFLWSRLLSGISAFFFLSLTIYQFYKVSSTYSYLVSDLTEVDYSNSLYFVLLRDSVVWIWSAFFLILITLIIELYIVFTEFYSKKKAIPK